MIKNKQKHQTINKQKNIVSVPLFSYNGSNDTRIKLINDNYHMGKIITNDEKSDETNIPIVNIGDNIYSVKFHLNLKGRKAISFKHLRIVNLEKENNAEVIFSKNIFSNFEICYISDLYRSFIRKFVKLHDYKF